MKLLTASRATFFTLIVCRLLSPLAAHAQGQEFFEGDYSSSDIIGNSLPGTWRPFSDDSPWNQPIPANATVHPENDQVMSTVVAAARNLRLSNSYMPSLWVVNADNMPFVFADSPYPFDTWDQNRDGRTEAGVPIDATMWPENTSDGHIIIVDPFRKLSWEMSKYTGIVDGVIRCTTFNIWDVTGMGVGDPNEGFRWQARGGRGSGFPVIAGLVRPEELEHGEINHALVFTFSTNRDDWFVYPAAHTDGNYEGTQDPMEGMLFQLDPSLTEADFNAWGLTREAKIVARALQKYGMYDGDNGGAMALQFQLLDPDPDVHAEKLDAMFPGFRKAIQKIPSDRFRIIDTGHEPTLGGGKSTVVSPLTLPIGGALQAGDTVTMSTSTRDAYITYTTDGTVPDARSTRYGGPIRMDESATVKARAFRSDMTPSGITRTEFWLDASCGGGQACDDPVPMPPKELSTE
jgi:hypothetical protein